MTETLIFLVSGVISALISAIVSLLFRLWDNQRAKGGAIQRPTTGASDRGSSRSR